MDYKLCNEFLKCDIEDCPSFNNTAQDKCWITPLTRCKDPVTGDDRPKMISEKVLRCFGANCRYHAYRKDVEE
jgi:hypothetical protein